MNKKLPRCSLPGVETDSLSSIDNLNLRNCHLWRWCEMVNRKKMMNSHDFQEMQQIHSQLHWIAQEIFWYNDISGSDIGIRAMEHFNDLWQQLLKKAKKINTEYNKPIKTGRYKRDKTVAGR
jgi:hypothetical protein